MSLSEILKPRAEVLSDEGIDGIIDLANLEDPKGKKLEANPKKFFNLTYPTADVRRIIQALADRFSGKKDLPGLFILEGLKGSGKSHILLMIYHLFKNYHLAGEWLDVHKMYFQLPDNTAIVLNKFTDLPLFSIWDFIFEQLTGRLPEKRIVQPGLKDIEKVLRNKKLILILDELEQGIRVISEPSIKQQNLAFLQMLSEWANRSNRITVFASIYSSQEEPGSTLKRVPSCRIQFEHSADKAKIVLHRLFENYLEQKNDAFLPVIESHLNIWRRQGLSISEEYRSEMLLTYPFIPEVLELIMERVPARGGFQSVRGALGFLANMVRLSHAKADLITAAHADLRDRETAARLSDLDPSGNLISIARGNLNDLKDLPLAAEIVATVMLYTLTGTGQNIGATREELMRHVLNSKADINDFEKTLLALQKYASNFWVQEGRYYFDLEENPDSKVEFRSLNIETQKALEHLHNIWREEIFREPNTVIFQGENQTKNALEELEKNRLRYILSPRKLSQEERHQLFHGIPMRNQVILLQPKDPDFNLNKNKDLIKWAQRQLAAQDLARTTKDSSRRAEYERIEKDDKQNSIETIKKAGLVYIHWEHYGNTAGEDNIEEEAIPGVSGEDVRKYLSQQLFPQQLFEEHISSRLNNVLGSSVKDIDRQYRSLLGFPVPVTVGAISQALRELCRNNQISINHPRGNFCGENPNLTETEIFEATIGEPFQPPASPPEYFPGGGEESGRSRPPEPSPIPPTVQTQEIRIAPHEDIGSLRQAVAQRLQEYPGSKITRIRATIFFEKITNDLSTIPAYIRGSLSGRGSVTTEITITKEGEFTKGDVESIVESLPSLPTASYEASLYFFMPSTGEEAEDEECSDR